MTVKRHSTTVAVKKFLARYPHPSHKEQRTISKMQDQNSSIEINFVQSLYFSVLEKKRRFTWRRTLHSSCPD